jgi:hypothetical protein
MQCAKVTLASQMNHKRIMAHISNTCKGSGMGVDLKTIQRRTGTTRGMSVTTAARLATYLWCYGRSTVVSDLDGWGFVLNVRWQKLARAGLYRSPYNGAMDKHTGESACQALKGKGRKGLCKVFQPKRMRCRDSTKYARERMYRGCCRGSTKYTTRTE